MRVEDVKIGTELFVYCRSRGGHGAWMTVTKINRKSFNAVETVQSYTPGNEWRIHKESKFALVERHPGAPWHRHWING